MIWQDVLLMMGGFGFSIALFPSVRKRVRMPWVTPLVTGGILTSFLIAYSTLGLWLAFGSTILVAGMWWYLFYIAIGRVK